MKIVRLYCDADGTSHFEDKGVAFEPVEYAPPAPALDLSEAMAASRVVFFTMPPGWFGDWHPTPVRQLYFALAGELEVTVSDGEVRVFHPGDVALVEDEAPPGHTTRVVGDEPARGAFVHMADQD